ncbi:MAG TPA: YceI family protein [Acidobacteriota bacterium]|nr:YceI family protein [Acidobacteriota bacterium]
MRKLLLLTALVSLMAAPSIGHAAAGLDARTWDVDGAHTAVGFKVRHFFTPISGSFTDYEIELSFDSDNPGNSYVEAKIAVVSVSTGNERRDNHLRSGDWFEAEAHPYITFRSDWVKKVDATNLVAAGTLTIKGVARQVELPIKLLGVQPIPEPMRDMMGGITEAASFQASLTIDRTEFGVGVGSWAETAIVGGDVQIELLVEANHS